MGKATSPITTHQRSRSEAPDHPGSFEIILKALTGIAAALAVFSALLSIFGFLLLRAHSNLLGLSNFLDHTVTDYFYEGSAFMVYSLYSVFALLVRHIKSFVIASMIFLAARLICRRITRVKKLSGQFGKSLVARPGLLVWICLILAAVALLYFIHQSLPSGEESNLLFDAGSYDERLKRTDARLEEMKTVYLNSLVYFVLSGTVLFMVLLVVRTVNAGRVTSAVGVEKNDSEEKASGPKRPEMNRALTVGQALLYVFVILQLFMLPEVYGRTVYSNSFHRIITKDMVAGESLKGLPGSNSVFLIKENPEYFILYYRDEQTLQLIRKEEVKNISLGGKENIFNGWAE
jgi:hypothetical protein